MTTEALRKVIKVTEWNLSELGLTISYEREDHSPKSLHLILTPIETLRGLLSIASIDDYSDNTTINVSWGDLRHRPIIASWSMFAISFKVSQWEALSLAIRHEEEKELANDMNMLELDSAINALK